MINTRLTATPKNIPIIIQQWESQLIETVL
jgi:hypothetical protein